MRYGITKKLITWKFWINAILIQLVSGIIFEWLFKTVGDIEMYSIGKFCLWWFLRVIFYVLGTILVHKLFKSDCLFDDETDFDEVERNVKKNQALWSKIEAINNTHSQDFPTDYPPRKAILLNYAKRHKLKDWERDYVRYKIRLNNSILRSVENGTW